MINVSHQDGDWVFFEDHDGDLIKDKSLVSGLKVMVEKKPKDQTIFICFTKTGLEYFRKLNP